MPTSPGMKTPNSSTKSIAKPIAFDR
jgi:hypothetical protein